MTETRQELRDSPLDRDMRDALAETRHPGPAHLSAETLHAHDRAIRREDILLAAKEQKISRTAHRIYQVFSILTAVTVIAVLLLTALDLPLFGEAANPTNNEVSGRYLASGLAEGGATNLVADMILDYRAFDTLGESNVLFTAACTVILLLRGFAGTEDRRLPQAESAGSFSGDPILQTGARMLFPAILLFGITVVLNGHLGPGGGFSGGAIMGAALILYLNAFGPESASRFFTFRFSRNRSNA